MDKDNFDELLDCRDDREKLNSFVNSNLSREQKSKLNEYLSDSEKLRSLLESDRAKAIINKFMKG